VEEPQSSELPLDYFNPYGPVPAPIYQELAPSVQATEQQLPYVDEQPTPLEFVPSDENASLFDDPSYMPDLGSYAYLFEDDDAPSAADIAVVNGTLDMPESAKQSTPEPETSVNIKVEAGAILESLEANEEPATEFIAETLDEITPPSEPPMEDFVESVVKDVVDESSPAVKPESADFIESVLSEVTDDPVEVMVDFIDEIKYEVERDIEQAMQTIEEMRDQPMEPAEPEQKAPEDQPMPMEQQPMQMEEPMPMEQPRPMEEPMPMEQPMPMEEPMPIMQSLEPIAIEPGNFEELPQLSADQAPNFFKSEESFSSRTVMWDGDVITDMQTSSGSEETDKLMADGEDLFGDILDLDDFWLEDDDDFWNMEPSQILSPDDPIDVAFGNDEWWMKDDIMD